MKKIDLHIHTQKCKQGDGKERNISVDDFIDKMGKNNIGVCAITNHNKFDIEEYKQIVAKAPELLAFPGIELDVQLLNGETKHIILICDPKCYVNFYNEFSNEVNRDYDNYKLNYNKFIEKIKKFKRNEIIIIPHFLDKDKKRALNIKDKDDLKEKLQQYVVILETSKLQSMGMINAHNEVALIGSDIMDWKCYEREAELLPELKFPIDSFGKFYELASDSKLFIKSALNGCEQYQVNLCSENGEFVEVYEDVNIIFGEKGSGKTVLLKNYIYPELQKSGKKVFLHEGKNYQDSYDKMLEDINLSVHIDEDLKEETIKNIGKLIGYKETINDNFIDKYFKYHNSETKNKNAKSIKKTEASYNKSETDTIFDIVEDLNKNLDNIKKVKYINTEFRYDKNKHKKLLLDELELLRKELNESAIYRCRNKFIVDKTNVVLGALKSILEKKTGKKSKPNNVGFSKLVLERKKHLEVNKKLVNDFETISKCRVVKLGELPDKGDINVEVSIKVLGKDEKHKKGSPFDRSKISDNREFIKKIYDFTVEDFPKVNEYFAKEEREKSAREYFEECVKKSCKVVRDNGEKYDPSEGEKSILSISGIMENIKYDCYLFDEIERGLGNKYISEYIIPSVKLLRERGKLVVISTHNANIAVSTLPSQTIYCNYIGDDKAEIYYQGNMYSNELKSIKDESNIVEWEEKALNHLEGSKKMFSIRRNIWNLRD